MSQARLQSGWLKAAQSADGVLAVDGDRKIVVWNEAAESLLGHTAGEAIGRKCHDLLGNGCSPSNAFCRPDCVVMANADHGLPTPAINIICKTSSAALRRISLSTVVAGSGGEVRLFHLFRDASGPDEPHPITQPGAGVKVAGETGKQQPRARRAHSSALPSLSRREAQALVFLAKGLNTVEIAAEMGIKRVTARNHIGRLQDRLGVRTRLQAVVAGYRLGLIDEGIGGLVRPHLSATGGER